MNDLKIITPEYVDSLNLHLDLKESLYLTAKNNKVSASRLRFSKNLAEKLNLVDGSKITIGTDYDTSETFLVLNHVNGHKLKSFYGNPLCVTKKVLSDTLIEMFNIDISNNGIYRFTLLDTNDPNVFLINSNYIFEQKD
jgi:hypothetical protein